MLHESNYITKSGNHVDVRNILLHFLSIANDLLNLKMVDVFRPTSLGVVNAFRLEIHRKRVYLNSIQWRQVTFWNSASHYIQYRLSRFHSHKRNFCNLRPPPGSSAPPPPQLRVPQDPKHKAVSCFHLNAWFMKWQMVHNTTISKLTISKFYLRWGGYVFVAVSVFVRLCVCVQIYQQVMNGFWRGGTWPRHWSVDLCGDLYIFVQYFAPIFHLHNAFSVG